MSNRKRWARVAALIREAQDELDRIQTADSSEQGRKGALKGQLERLLQAARAAAKSAPEKTETRKPGLGTGPYAHGERHRAWPEWTWSRGPRGTGMFVRTEDFRAHAR